MIFLMNDQGPPTQMEVDVPTYRGVRTRTHTYAVQFDGRWCLYDNTADPYQVKNLVRDPANKALIEKLDAALIAWSKSTCDAFPYHDVPGSYSPIRALDPLSPLRRRLRHRIWTSFHFATG